jgi:hypothetical protein
VDCIDLLIINITMDIIINPSAIPLKINAMKNPFAF